MKPKINLPSRRVSTIELPMVTIRAIWVNCLRGDADAMRQKNLWHQKHPELDKKFADFCATIERIRDPKQRKRKKKSPPTDVAKTKSVWTKAQGRFMESSKSSAWPVSGGLPSLGKRK